jgi:hypothetical protein
MVMGWSKAGSPDKVKRALGKLAQHERTTVWWISGPFGWPTIDPTAQPAQVSLPVACEVCG